MPTKRAKPSGPSTVNLDAEVADYLLARSARERSLGREDAYKARFMNMLAEFGQPQEGGHRIIMLSEPVAFHSYKAGKATEKSIAGIRRVRRAPQKLNVDKAMALLERLKLVTECTITEVVVNEDAILAANFSGRIPDVDLKAIYDESESFAFFLVEEGADPEQE